MVAHAQMGGKGTLGTGEPSEYDTGLADSFSRSRVVLSEAVDCCIRFTPKIQHGGDLDEYLNKPPVGERLAYASD